MPIIYKKGVKMASSRIPLTTQEKMLMDIVDVLDKNDGMADIKGGNILDFIKKGLKQTLKLGKAIVQSPEVKKRIIACIKKMVGGARNKNKKMNNQKLIKDLLKVHEKHEGKLKGGFIQALIPIIVSLASSLGITLTPIIKDKVIKCVQGMISGGCFDCGGGAFDDMDDIDDEDMDGLEEEEIMVYGGSKRALTTWQLFLKKAFSEPNKTHTYCQRKYKVMDGKIRRV